MGGTGLEPVTPSLSSPQSCYAPLVRTPSLWPLCRSFRTLPAAACALVLGLRLPLQLAPVSTAAAASSRRENLLPKLGSPAGDGRSQNRCHRQRRVVEFCHSGGGIWTDINDHVSLQPDPGLLIPRSQVRSLPGPSGIAC